MFLKKISKIQAILFSILLIFLLQNKDAYIRRITDYSFDTELNIVKTDLNDKDNYGGHDKEYIEERYSYSYLIYKLKEINIKDPFQMKKTTDQLLDMYNNFLIIINSLNKEELKKLTINDYFLILNNIRLKEHANRLLFKKIFNAIKNDRIEKEIKKTERKIIKNINFSFRLYLLKKLAYLKLFNSLRNKNTALG